MNDNGGRAAYLKPIDFDKDPHKTVLDAAEKEEKTGNNPSPRNLLQNTIIEYSDEMCEKHKGDIVGNSATTNLVLGLGAASASAISAIVTGAAATNYAVGSTILNAGRSEMNAEIYQGMLATAIIKAITESREKKLGEIRVNQLKKPNEYTVKSAIVDAQDYHFRCSFYHGLVILNEDAKKRATPSREELLGRIRERRAEMESNNAQKGLAGAAITTDPTNQKLQQGIDSIIDKLNTIDR